MAASGLEIIVKRNEFYRSNYKVISMIIVLQFLIIFGLIGFIYYKYHTRPAPIYFATTPDGIPIQIVPLVEPYVTDDFVLDWAKKAVVSIYSLDFLTYRKTLQDNSVYFTWIGHAQFLNAYKASNNLEAVREKRQVVSAEITGPGKILYSGVVAGEPYTWRLMLPVTFTYQNSENEIIKQSGDALLVIQRDSTLRHPEGIAINQLIFEARTS